MAIFTTLAAIAVARTVGTFVNNVSERFFPYKKSRIARQVEHSAELNAKNQIRIAEIRAKLEKEMQERGIKNQNDLAYFTALANRQTSLLVARHNASSALRNFLIQEAVRNFPLNISPLILLENNNININALLGEEYTPANESILDQILASKPLSVFVTPIHIDSCIASKKEIVTQVWDNVYLDLETMFVKEYARHSERPVIFYPTAWNHNVKSGLHSAEQLYYFLKDLPSLVIEPRYDGKTLKVMISCWGLGNSTGTHFRQELNIDIDWMQIITDCAYDRSIRCQKSLSKIENPSKIITDKITACEHNIKMYEQLGLSDENRHKEVASYCDYTRLFSIDSLDLKTLSKTISSGLGLSIATVSDTHHILVSDVEPRLPYIFKEYFKEYFDQKLLQQFSNMYAHIYAKLDLELKESVKHQCLKRIEAYKVSKMLTEDNNKNASKDLYEIIIAYCEHRCSDDKEAREKIKTLIDLDAAWFFYLGIFDNNIDNEFNTQIYGLISTAQQNQLQNQININKAKN